MRPVRPVRLNPPPWDAGVLSCKLISRGRAATPPPSHRILEMIHRLPTVETLRPFLEVRVLVPPSALRLHLASTGAGAKECAVALLRLPWVGWGAPCGYRAMPSRVALRVYSSLPPPPLSLSLSLFLFPTPVVFASILDPVRRRHLERACKRALAHAGGPPRSALLACADIYMPAPAPAPSFAARISCPLSPISSATSPRPTPFFA